ncbi:DoxX family protein [Actinomadura syzygii]|uniref:DoxX family protein n=1 Tax=Actinomadura syzygii TaxID=1427538 RepID=A0A5D0TUB2_9ACTN|nr:DoxX family protein [Actinomadura syzygii]TYC09010.1 DoxX family protein [Actinomadura syzygii]
MDEVSAGLLLVRVVVGLTLAAHGYNKFFGGGRIPGTARWFESIGMRPGRLHALAAASTELGAGVLFAAGLLTPLAAAGFVGLMLVAAWTVHRANGFFSAGNGWEYNLVLAVAAAGVATTGPGDWSLDAAAGLDIGGWGLLVAAGGGLAAGAGLLAACYRPAPRTDGAPAEAA